MFIEMEGKTPCPVCGQTKRKLILRIIPTGKTEYHWPTYIPQITERCFYCWRYIKFTAQTPEVIEELNNALKENEPNL